MDPDGGLLIVAPFAGAWIEIYCRDIICKSISVAPFAGAWIEIQGCDIRIMDAESLPLRERGLK